MGAQKRGAQKRGAQKRGGGCCYAACERLAGELGWTRQRLMRHIRRLLDLSLITYNNPTALGVPREYIPVAQEGARRLSNHRRISHA
jgi:hypothetical protein